MAIPVDPGVLPRVRKPVVRPRRRLRTAVPLVHPHPSRYLLPPIGGVHPDPPPGSTAPPAAPPAAPDYNALLKGMPEYQTWLASRNARLGNLATNRAAAIRQLALQFGGIPAGFKDAYGDIRAQDRDAASHNQYSVSAQIAANDATGRNDMHRSLAARGMLQSGDLGYGEQQADKARGSAEYGAAQQFMSALNDAVSGYTSGVGDVNAEEPGLIAGLLAQLRELYPMPAPADPAAPPAGAAPPLRVALPAPPRAARPRIRPKAARPRHRPRPVRLPRGI